MGRGVALCKDLRERIVHLTKEGLSYKKISENLIISKSTVQYIIKNYKTTSSTSTKPQKGANPKTSLADDRALKRIIRENRRESASDIKRKWQQSIGKKILLVLVFVV